MNEELIIIRFTARWLTETTWSNERFAVEKLFPSLIQMGLAEDAPVVGDDWLKYKTAKGVQVGRILSGTMNFPLAWKWAWVKSLPEPYQGDCRKQLLALAGVLDVPAPQSVERSKTARRANIAAVMREFAEVMENSKPAQDGVYDENDDGDDADRLIDEMVDAIEALERELAAVMEGTGRQGQRQLVRRVRP